MSQTAQAYTPELNNSNAYVRMAESQTPIMIGSVDQSQMGSVHDVPGSRRQDSGSVADKRVSFDSRGGIEAANGLLPRSGSQRQNSYMSHEQPYSQQSGPIRLGSKSGDVGAYSGSQRAPSRSNSVHQQISIYDSQE